MVDNAAVADYGTLSERLVAEVFGCMFDSGGKLICLSSGDRPLGAIHRNIQEKCQSPEFLT